VRGLRKPAGRETCQHSWGARKLLVSAKVNGVEIISHALAFFLNPSQTFEAANIEIMSLAVLQILARFYRV
jgi:hypothetical protein